ncbi:MAG: hypothetical protein JNN25_05195 [Candidatus Kapabacteria bacterium]|nr:hypothetical protein [Candidatus Kapabacteria bacterium]
MKHFFLSILPAPRVVFALLTLGLVMCFALEGCRKKRGATGEYEFGTSTPAQNIWVGYFHFDEYGGGDIGEANPTAIFVGHVLTVRQSGDSLRANLSANGPHHSSELICSVNEKDDTLNVYFQRYGENHDSVTGKYQIGAHLFSLVRDKYTLYTKWDSYKPVHIPFTPKLQGSVCFMKENEDNVPNIDIEPFSAYWAEYVQALTTQDSVKLAYMTAFPLVGSNYVRPEGALTDIVSKTDFMMNYHVVLFPALRKVLQVKKASDFQARPKTEDDNIYLPNGLVPVGAQLYCLTVTSTELNRFTEIAPEMTDTKQLTKEQAEILRRNNKIAKELNADYKWAFYVARLQGKYRVCYVGVAPGENPL